MRPVVLQANIRKIFPCKTPIIIHNKIENARCFLVDEDIKRHIKYLMTESPVTHYFICILIFVFFISCFSYLKSTAQNQSSCPNADFEMNSFINWVATTGYCCPINATSPGLVAGQHTIMTGPGVDPYSLGQIPVVAPGGNYSVRLGNNLTGAQAEKLQYSFTVTSQTDLFIYRYAVVLEDPAHSASAQPRFEIRVYDANGNAVNCGSYNVVASANIPGFQNNGNVRFKTWTTVGIELSAYLNQTLTIEFSTGDCGYGGHFGYAYIDCFCSPLIISSDICPGTPAVNLVAPLGFYSYLWNTGQTTSSISINNPVLGSQYTVTMTSVTGCTVSLSTILNPSHLTANFTVNSYCQNKAVFADSSYIQNGTPVTSWLWDFGDSTTSSLQNPVHVYGSPGIYFVTLIAGNAGGCADTITKQVTIMPPPVAGFIVTGASCSQIEAQFTDSSWIQGGSINNWVWDFGDGDSSLLQNPKHTYAVPGSYNVTLIVTDINGCSDTVSQAVNTVSAIFANFNFSNPCSNLPVIFDDSSYITFGNVIGWNWDFGDGSFSVVQNPSHVYAAAGTYSCSLICYGNNGCQDTVTKIINIAQAPQVSFSGTHACFGYPVSFSDNSILQPGTIYNWNWNFGDSTVSIFQNPLHNYSMTGTYTVALVINDNKGCKDSATSLVSVYDSPVADFKTDTTCLHAAAIFQDNSFINAGNINSWNWSFGDAHSSSLQNNLHNYQQAGNYQVTLIVISDFGCSDTLTKTITILPSPVSSFTVPVICEGNLYVLNNQSYILNGTIGSQMWDFGNGTGSSQVNPSVIFAGSGNYTVRLITTATSGCSDTMIRKVDVFPEPVADFSVVNECPGIPVQFTDQSLLSSGNIASWNWNFGDGSAASVKQNPVHAFDAPPYGYMVNLIVQSDEGCTDSISRQVNVFWKPNAAFTNDTACANEIVSFFDHSVIVPGNMSSWNWSFGDGITSVLQNPQHHFNTEGYFEVTLIVISGNGCADTIVKHVFVNGAPVVTFDASDACYTDPNEFKDLSVVSSGSIVNSNWNFGDSTFTSFISNPLHTYLKSGIYQATLIAVSSAGCMDTFSRPVKVYQKPVVEFAGSLLSGCTPVNVEFNEQVSSVDGTIVNLYWDFGDGNYSDGSHVNHVYESPGVYHVELMATSSFGCTAENIKENYIEAYPVPVAGFISAPDFPTMVSPLVAFFDRSSGANQWLYNFGDGIESSLSDPQHIYLNPGKYNIWQVVMNEYLCADTSKNFIEVKNDYAFYVPDAFTPNEDGINDVFTISGLNINSFSMQIFDRWGKLIFENGLINKGWSGETREGVAPMGTYVYRIVYMDIFSHSHEIYGRVSLIR